MPVSAILNSSIRLAGPRHASVVLKFGAVRQSRARSLPLLLQRNHFHRDRLPTDVPLSRSPTFAASPHNHPPSPEVLTVLMRPVLRDHQRSRLLVTAASAAGGCRRSLAQIPRRPVQPRIR